MTGYLHVNNEITKYIQQSFREENTSSASQEISTFCETQIFISVLKVPTQIK